MAITYVSSASAASSSVSLPSFTPGDIAIVIAGRFDASSAPSLPSGWTDVGTGTGTGMAARCGYRVLQSGDTTTGTWTGATKVGVIIYSGVLAALPHYTNGANVFAESASTSVSITFLNGVPSLSRQVHLALADVDTGTNLDEIYDDAPPWVNRTSGGNDWFGVCDIANEDGNLGGYTLGTSSALLTAKVQLYEDSGFPIIADADTTSGTVTSNLTDWTLTYPSNIAAGDLLIALVAHDGDSGTYTWPSGWVGVARDNGTTVGQFQAKKSATGSESGTFTLTLSGSEQGSWVIYRIPAGTWEGTLGSTWSNAASGGAVTQNGAGNTDGTPDPPNLLPAEWDVEDTLWLAVVSVDTSRTVTDYSNWTSAGFFAYADYISGGSNGATLAVARLESAAASVDPGTITISSSDDWVAATIAIRPAAAPPAATSLPPIPARFHLIRR